MSPAAEAMLAGFLNQLKFEKRASVHTVSNYQRDIGRLSNYCKDKLILNWTDLKQNDIRAHIATRHRKGMGSKSESLCIVLCERLLNTREIVRVGI